MHTAFHVTPTRNIDSIRRVGLLPASPLDMPGEQSGVYLFPTIEDVRDAFGSWLEGRFNDDEALSLVCVDVSGLAMESDAAFELRSVAPIPAERILRVVDLDGPEVCLDGEDKNTQRAA